MDRLSLCFFAAAVLIAGTAAAGLAVRAGLGTRVADASISSANFDGVVAGGSTREVPTGASFLVEPVEPAAARVASAPVVRPVAKRRTQAAAECAVPGALAIALVAAVEPVSASGAGFARASVPPGFVPFEEWTEVRKNALKATLARTGEAAARHEVHRIRIDRVRTQLRTLERIEGSAESEESDIDVLVPGLPEIPGIVPPATTQG